MSLARSILLIAVIGAPISCQRDDPCRASYVDVTASSGIEFVHKNGASGRFYFIETNGSGAGFFDYDRDGDMDLYVVQSGRLEGFEHEGKLGNKLYRNDGGMRFADVTDQARVGDEGYGMGCALADYDGDGWPDIFVYNWGPDVLYRNQGDGTFEDVTVEAGVGDPGNGGAAVFADFDRDSDLDLFVGNYVRFSYETNVVCSPPPVERSYCHPDVFPPDPDTLYRNNGDGTFSEVTHEAGITRTEGKALGATIGDVDGDGDMDLFVANDSTPNDLYRNDSADGRISLTDISNEANVAYDRDGRTQGCMGCDLADIDGDLDLDLIVTNLSMEHNALYVNDGAAYFEDLAYPRGIGRISLLDFGWGTRFFDHDFDGDNDLLVINGHLHYNVSEYDASQSYLQSPRLFENDGKGFFREAGASAGPFFAQKISGRGLAMADVDNDGDLDFFVNCNNQRGILVECQGEFLNRWIGLWLKGKSRNPDAIGAEVKITAGGRRQVQTVRGSLSYASFQDLRLLFGLSSARRVDAIEVLWPDGDKEVFPAMEAGRYHEIVQGTGRPTSD